MRIRRSAAILVLTFCAQEKKPAPVPEAEVTASPRVSPEALALCEATRDSNPSRCTSSSCRRHYELLRVLFREMLGTPKCETGSQDFRQICLGATDRQMWQCSSVSADLQPLCSALASHDPSACHPTGGRECVDLYWAAAGVSRGDFSMLVHVRDLALRTAAKATLGRVDCAVELARSAQN